jgi:oligopeptide transport system ATP-binding protein
MTGTPPLLSVRNLKTYFPVKSGVFRKTVAQVKAVDDISFQIFPGETLGLVGESGCGKSTTGRSILQLVKPSSGEIEFDAMNLLALRPEKLRAARRSIRMIFQDPFASLDPRMSVEQIVEEPLVIHRIGANRKERRERVIEILTQAGLDEDYLSRYPHEFSGGQRQRIGIARALVCMPRLVIADEPVSALDVSIQAQIINLLRDLKQQFNLTYLFIAHDLSVVRHISDRVIVMYLGKIIEVADRDGLFGNPLHPYTKALLAAVPEPDPDIRSAEPLLTGDIPSPIHPPSGCRFRTRCPIAQQVCAEKEPLLVEHAPGHQAACWFVGEDGCGSQDIRSLHE